MVSRPQDTPASFTASADLLVRSPEMASNSSDWPLPATPATATTSPARTVRSMLFSATPNGIV